MSLSVGQKHRNKGDNNMKKTAMIATALCLSFMASGCITKGQDIPGPSEASGSEISGSTTEEPASAHEVTVDVITLVSSDDGLFNQVVPNVTVDGKEATDINDMLSSYIRSEYPLEINDEYTDGMATRLYWGTKDNVLSIVIYAGETFTDYYTYDVFNFDLETQNRIDSREVLEHLGMTDEDFLSQASGIVESYCADSFYDLDRSVAAVDLDNCIPFVTPDGNTGFAANIYYPADSQFAGSAARRCLSLATKDVVVFEQ